MANNLIGLRRVSKAYQKRGASVVALRDINLSIQQGEMVAIWGPSGSGKSTLLNIIGTLDFPSSGEYRFAGKALTNLTDWEISLLRARRMGFIFQSFNLLDNLSAVENVILPTRYAGTTKRGAARQRALELLQQVGLSERAGHLPGELSGGEEQRVAVARALINDPDIILADEPTGNLDSKSHRDILDLLVKLHQAGKTLLVVSHNPDVIGVAERVIRLRDGRIEA